MEVETVVLSREQTAEEKRLVSYLSSVPVSGEGSKLARAKQDEIENAIYELGRLYAQAGDATRLKGLLSQVKPLFSLMPHAKTAKIVYTLVNLVSQIPNVMDLQVELCLDSIEWAKKSERTFLRQKIEARLASCYLDMGAYTKALKVLAPLLTEIKRFDDKLLLVEVFLIESRVHHKLRNIAKAKASLTAARTSANAVYCPPSLQAQIDLQAGILHAEEKDFKTAYSYFYESFEAFNTSGDDDPSKNKEAMGALKYMLLCKIMLNSIGEVNQLISAKAAQGYTGREVQAMRAMANAHHARSLEQFSKTKEEFKEELTQDEVMSRHLMQLEDTLFEQNLCRIIEPFSCVEITHVAELIDLPVDQVERKLSQMILDKKLSGILDQGAGTLIVHDSAPADQTYPAALETIQSLGKVVDSLFQKALAAGRV